MSEPIVTFDRLTCSLDAIQRASYVLADVVTMKISQSDDSFECFLYPREDAADIREIEHRLRAEVIDQILRARIAEQTEPLRNLIFALAFSRTGLVSPKQPDE